MMEGFYQYRSKIYYGTFDETQVLKQQPLKKVKSKNIMTDHEIGEEDEAVVLWDNHGILEPEKKDLMKSLEILSEIYEEEIKVALDFDSVEKKLGKKIPEELKAVYSFMGNSPIFFQGKERFLPLEELYMNCGQLVFYEKKKKPEVALDLKTGCLTRYFRKEWELDSGDYSVSQFFQSHLITSVLKSKSVTKRAKLKGRFIASVDIKKELMGLENEQFHVLSELDLYGIAVMYSKDGLIAWFRNNGFYADAQVGAATEKEILEFGRYLGDIKWKILR